MMQINPPDDWLRTGWTRDSQARTRLVDSMFYIIPTRAIFTYDIPYVSYDFCGSNLHDTIYREVMTHASRAR